MRQRTVTRQSWILTLLSFMFPLTMNLQASGKEDPYLWLEEVLGSEALEWVETQNHASQARLESDERFAAIRDAALAVYSATDRIAYAGHAGTRVFNFWQDERHMRGILRAASIGSYLAGEPEWETLLDIDALAEAEGENWVYKGRACLRPDFERCMISLSRGGADAVVVREFNVRRQAFVEDGFISDEAKQDMEWLDEDHLLISKAGSGFRTTDSGYSAEVRLWKRGESLEESRRLFEVSSDYVSATPVVVRSSAGTHVFVVGSPGFFREQVSYLGDPLAEDVSPTQLPLPEDIDWRGMFGKRIIALTRSAWDVDGHVHPAGALVAVPLGALLQGDLSGVETVLVPPETGAIQSVQVAQSHLYVSIMDNVRTRLVRLSRDESNWMQTQVDVPSTGTLSIVSATSESGLVFVNGEEFLVPDSLHAIEGEAKPRVIAQLPARFDSSAYLASQSFATSADGTRVPYFLVKRRDAEGPAPTLLYGYGGFEISLTPSYLGPLPVAWLEAGGAYVIANIRGGGEFGPAWHQAALQANRQRAYDDFAAVAEDLIDTGVTEAAKLGIYGGSNGGLLVGALLTQRPELFGAVVCAVPLLDMLRYHKLLAGASWIAEYGDPDVPEERAWLAAYSPYQNVRDDVDYPQVFLTTSTRDDRVHPGHARKMTARMIAAGHDVVYYENTEGGHSAAANLNQVARRDALVVTFLMQALMDRQT